MPRRRSSRRRSNPLWADRLIHQYRDDLRDAFGSADVLPIELSAGEDTDPPVYVDMGAGMFGVVYPTPDPNRVFKLTTDATEARFAHISSKKKSKQPAGIVRYYGAREMPGHVDGLQVWGEPVMSVMSFGSTTHDIMAIGDVMDDHGWHLDRQHGPDALHFMVSPEHEPVADAFLADLREAVATHGESRGKDARYS